MKCFLFSSINASAEPIYNDASDTSDEGEIQSDEELFITHRKKKITAPAAGLYFVVSLDYLFYLGSFGRSIQARGKRHGDAQEA